MAGRKPGGKDFAPRVRSAVDRVIKRLEKNGEIDSILLQAIREDPINSLQKLASYAPKQLEATVTHTIEDFVAERATLQSKKNITIEHDSSQTELH
jgi:hypothetical protein